jgi:hypothetical protein
VISSELTEEQEIARSMVSEFAARVLRPVARRADMDRQIDRDTLDKLWGATGGRRARFRPRSSLRNWAGPMRPSALRPQRRSPLSARLLNKAPPRRRKSFCRSSRAIAITERRWP